jgi:hypothetical protein
MEDDMDETGALNAAADDMAGASGPLSAFDVSRIQEKLKAYQDVGAERKAFYDNLEKELLARRTGPSLSERLYQLSAAFAKPTRTRGFAGVMNNIMPVLQQQAQVTREGVENRQEALSKLRLAQLAEKQNLLGQELTTELKLADLQRKSNAPVRGVATGDVLRNPYTGEIIGGGKAASVPSTSVVEGVTYLNTPGGRPSTPVPERSKFRAATPEEAAAYGAKSGQINITTGEFKPITQALPKLSQAEQRELIDTEDLLTKGASTATLLQQALSLNNTAYEGSLSGARKTLGQLFASDSPEYVATEQLDNLIGTSALESLKATFGANPTEGERKILLDLQASTSKPRAVRQQIITRALQAAQSRIRINTQRLEKLKGGYYSTRGGSASSPQPSKVIRFDKNGNRI